MNPITATSSPFLNAESFAVPTYAGESSSSFKSPFVQAFALEDAHSGISAHEGARRLLLAELHDEEFEDALYELAGETARVARQLPDERLSAAALELYLAPLAREIDTTLLRARDHFAARDVTTIDEAELEEVLSARDGAPLEPAMEQLFGSIKNAIKRAAKGAAGLAAKGLQAAIALGLGPIINRIRKALPDALRKLVKLVIKRLPEALQADARRLAVALGAGESEYENAPEVAFDISGIQREFNEQVADALLSEGEEGLDREEPPWRPLNEYSVGVADLDRMREQFMSELEELGEGEDPLPAVERFVPALVPALMLAKKIVPRRKIVGLLSGMVAKLISRFVGPQPAQALSRALVDAGLKLVGFEVTPETERQSAHAAIAATVEETVRRVAALPDEELDDEQLAQGAILREFEAAAAANFPALLPRAVYRQRPDLMETHGRRGVWVPCPVGKPGKRFKKYTQVIRTRITPRMAMVIPAFDGAPLGWFLQEELGIEPGKELEADVHLYEAMPGMLLPEIGDLEAPGSGDPTSEQEYHPLTAEAASLLLGEPGLGHEVKNPNGPARNMAVGQRFYRLAVPGRRVLAGVGAGATGRRRRTHLHVTLDLPKSTVILYLYLGERRSQHVATALRTPGQAGAVLARLRPVVERLLQAVLSVRSGGRLRILHEALPATQAPGAGLQRAPAGMVQALVTRVGNSALGGIAEFFKTQTARFLTATQDQKNGVTLQITITGLEGLAALRAAIAGQGTQGAAPAVGGTPTVKVEVNPGHVRG